MSNQLIQKKKHIRKQIYYDHLQADLFRELYKIYAYASKNYGSIIKEKATKISEAMEVSEQTLTRIYPQLAWWVILKESLHLNGDTIFGMYLKTNRMKWEKKHNALQQILTSWQTITPGFYITKTVAPHQRSGTLLHIVGLKRYTLSVSNKKFEPLKRGELLIGFLLPIGNHMYTSPVDLFHITPDDAPRVTWEVLLHYHQHTISSDKPPHPDLYLSLIKSALEIIDD